MTHVQTTLPAGTDNQSFCYDEQNRLVWASSYSGTGPCGIVNNGGSLTAQGAKYTASYTYDALNRLTSAPLGSYTYGDPAHLHATTGVSGGSGGGFVGKYDAAGNLSCQASCGLEPTPQEIDLSYDNERRLTKWSHGGASTTVAFAYDGEGRRVAQSVTTNGSTSTTRYLAGGLEEVTTSGSNTTLTKYESVPGVCSVVIVGSGPSESISYVTTDGLGSVSEALDGNGNVTAQQLYGPYGTGRFSLGALPAAKGYTGQYADAATGLDYYNARYYDPAIGQFASADSVDAGGLNRYAYVADDPETQNDPSGHCWPLCAIVAAVVTAVVVTTAQAAIQYVTTGQVDWGSDLKTGAMAGVMVGATLLAGPAAELAGGAIAGAVSGGATALGASAAAGEVAGSVVAGGIMGAGEGLVQGAIAGDRGGDLLADAGIGALSGGAGGALGSVAGRLGRLGRNLGGEELGARVAGMVGNGFGNAASQGIQIVTGRQDGFDMGSVAISAGAGWGWGSAVTSDQPTFRSFQRHPFLTAASFAGIDAAVQGAYAFFTGRLGYDYSSGDIVVHSRHGW